MSHLPLRTALGYRDSSASLGTFSATSNGDLVGASDDEALDAYDRLEIGDVDIDLKDLTLIRKHVHSLVRKLQRRMEKRMPKTPRRVKMQDKVAFMFGVVMALLGAYWLGLSPRTFYQFYTVASVLLFTARFITYHRKKWHYYFLDFCYAANIFQLAHLWFLPNSTFMHKACFAYGAGPLAWSIIAFRNSLVFHSLDKVTSLFLHFFPAVVAWSERWHTGRHGKALLRSFSRTHPTPNEWGEASFTEIVLFPMVPYLAWAVLYYAKIFIVSSEKIRLRGYETLYTYSTSNPNSALARFVASVAPQWQPLVYMSLHIFLTTATFVVAKIFWNFYYAHTTFLVVILGMSAWNGASYYFEVFAHRYAAGLDALNQEHNPGSPLGREAKEAGQQNGTSSPHQHSPLRDGHGPAENGDLPEANGDMPVQDEVVGLPSADELAVDAAPKKDQ